MKIGIAAAGSGGHLFPAIAVADALVELGLEPDDVVFFGGDRMETRVVPEAGYELVKVDVHGMRRSLSADNLRLPLKVRKATTLIAERIALDDIRAMVVFGGYVSGPAGLAARRAKIPFIIHEANAVPGLANRMLAPLAHTVFVAFEPARTKLKRAEAVGNPLRSVYEPFDRDRLRPVARARYGIDEHATVLGVIGGSLGARALNEIAAEIAGDSTRHFEILHVSGELHFETMATQAAEREGWTVLAFEAEMEYVYAASDVVISRCGAITVSELHASATPAILVPLPAGGGYQGMNAHEFVMSGGGVVISEDHRDDIIRTALEMLGDDVKRKEMASTAAAARQTGVARRIAEHALEIAHV